MFVHAEVSSFLRLILRKELSAVDLGNFKELFLIMSVLPDIDFELKRAYHYHNTVSAVENLV